MMVSFSSCSRVLLIPKGALLTWYFVTFEAMECSELMPFLTWCVILLEALNMDGNNSQSGCSISAWLKVCQVMTPASPTHTFTPAAAA